MTMAAQPEAFALSVRRQGARIEVALRGELDAYSAPQLHAGIVGLGEIAGRHVVLDLGEVGFVDSAGLAAIVAALRVVKDGDGAVSVRSMSPQLHKLFEITGLARLLPAE